MRPVSDEMVSAYLDGEADEQAQADIERALQSDPRLAVRLLRLAKHDRLIRDAIDDELGPMPERLSSAATEYRGYTAVVALKSLAPRTREFVTWAFASAACLIVGLVAGPLLQQGHTNAVMVAGHSGPVAGPQLADALFNVRSGESRRTGGAVVNVVLSFQSNDGRLCRQFGVAFASAAGTGIACRTPGGWRIEAWSARAASPSSGYQTAGGPEDSVVSAAIARLGVAQPLDRTAEAAAINAKWRPSLGR